MPITPDWLALAGDVPVKIRLRNLTQSFAAGSELKLWTRVVTRGNIVAE